MQLKYLKHTEGQKHFVYGGVKMDAFSVSPVGEVPDSLAISLIRNKPDCYAVYLPDAKVETEETGPVKCELCGKEVTTLHALTLHKKFKHKG